MIQKVKQIGIIITRMTVLLTLIIGITMSVNNTVYAYNYEDYEYTDEGDIIVKDVSEAAESTAVLCLYADTVNGRVGHSENHYMFYCTEGAVVEGRKVTPLMFKFNPMDAVVYDTLSGGEIWVWNFALENGVYKFASPAGSSSSGTLPNIYTLSSEFEFLEYLESDKKTVLEYKEDPITVENEEVRIYAMYGDSAWREEHYDEFRKWAEETEKECIEKEKTLITRTAEAVEDILERTESTDVTQETLSDVQEESQQTFESTSEKNQENDRNKKSGSIGIGFGIIICALFLGVFVVVHKKK